ncbi:unnamed protein product [Cochlearia groenlandica]
MEYATKLLRKLLETREGSSSTSTPTPLECKDKQKQIVNGHREVDTHFVSLPLAIYPDLKKKLEAFQNSILCNNDYKKKPLKFQSTLSEMGIDKSIFVSKNTLHVTVVMLKLGNKESVDLAIDILKSISPNVMLALNNRPVFVRLKNLESMNGSLDKTRVLYAPVEEVGHDQDRLLNACYVIIDAFVKAGLAAKDAKSRLKLHVTVMNASYRKGKDKSCKKIDTFDAREIHKEFGNKDWGIYRIREAHISKRYQYDPTGYFHCCSSLPFPHK